MLYPSKFNTTDVQMLGVAIEIPSTYLGTYITYHISITEDKVPGHVWYVMS
jgi:hypothetical protein